VTSIVTKYDKTLANQIQEDLTHNREMRPKARSTSPYNTKVALKKRDFRGRGEKPAVHRATSSDRASIHEADSGQIRKKKPKKSGVLKAKKQALRGSGGNFYENL